MRFLRILFSIILLLVLVCVLAIVGLIYFMDPNQLKPVIIKEVKKQTGYQLAIEGNLSWTLYPRLGVKVEHMTLTAPNQTAVFADLKNVNIVTPLSQLKDWKTKLSGNLYIGSVRLAKVNAHNAHIGLHWQNNVLTLEPINAKFYEGSLSGMAHGQAFSTVPAWDWTVQFNKIQIKPLLEDINGVNSKIKLSGAAQVNIQAKTKGVSREQILGNLQGSTQISVSNGIVEGVDFNYLIETADALINKQPVTSPSSNQTLFNSFSGTMNIQNGVATTNNLSLVSSSFATSGQGNINLISQTLNLDLQIKTQKNIKTQWEIPVTVTGNLASPSVGIDMREVQKYIAKRELEQIKDKVKDKVKDEIKNHIPGKAGEFLQNILGN